MSAVTVPARSLGRAGPPISRSLGSQPSSRLPTSTVYASNLHFQPSPQRNLSTTPCNAASGPSLLGGSSSSSAAIPPSYFQRPSLPANTIIRFVPQQTAWIVERMGKFNRILQPGIALLYPILDRIAYVKSLKEAAIEIPSQSAITADNVTLELDGVLYTRVFDAYKARYAPAPMPKHLPWSRKRILILTQLRRGRRGIRHLPTRPDNHALRNRPPVPRPRPA